MTANEICCWNLPTQVIDSVEDYLKLLRAIFDFDALKALLHKPDFTFTFDAMHGVAGPYAKRIFVQVCTPFGCNSCFSPNDAHMHTSFPEGESAVLFTT